MTGASWLRRRALGLLVGVGVTLAATGAYVAGGWDWLSLPFLDLLFRTANRVDADPRIVLIDINDAALQRVGRWPWPRRAQADLVDVLSECGAHAILLDLIYAEPTPGRVVHPMLDPDYDLEAGGDILGAVTPDSIVRDDQELADAIRRAANVYVAMYLRLADPGDPRVDMLDRARAIVDADPAVSRSAFAAAVGGIDADRLDAMFLRVRIEHALCANFALTVEALAEQLGVDPVRIERHISEAKERAARRIVRSALQRSPGASFAELRAEILPDVAPDTETRDVSDLRRAYRRFRALRAVVRSGAAIPEALGERIPAGYDLMPPISVIADAARRVGFVSFRTDADGVLRHVPLLADVAGGALPQLACAMAADLLGIDWADTRADGGRRFLLRDTGATRTWSVRLTERGEVLLNWHIDRDDPRWQNSFTHIPAARIMEVAQCRRDIDENRARLRLWTAQAVELMYGGASSAYLDYERLVRRVNGTSGPMLDATERAEAVGRIERVEAAALAQLKRLYDQAAGVTPRDAEEAALFDRVGRLHQRLITGDLRGGIEKANHTLEARASQLLDELRPMIGGKLCFVGHTAAAQADMVNTPVVDDMPGVMAHANLVNMLLTGRICTIAGSATHIALLVLTGLLATFLATTRGPWVTFGCVAVIMGALVGGAWLSMRLRGYYIAGVVPAFTVFVCWALITLYRQLTEQRQKRSFARELSRNTSPAIAARIADQLDDLDLTPQPVQVTCYFSDLEGFTTISEQLSARQTQDMLNRYLGVMGEKLVALQAFNKFMGDGIFAFFNAPILPLADHAAVACDAALATSACLEAMKKQRAGRSDDPIGRLRMRIGLNTGPAFVGYFGSENQTDYTCIGDTVNLAARLEAANKVFGTRILVSESCMQAGGNGKAFRPLGRLQVKGKARAVPVFELLGRAGEIDPSQQAYADLFAEGVARFQQRDWTAANTVWRSCRAQRCDDPAVDLYAELTARHAANPPPDDWNQGVALTSK